MTEPTPEAAAGPDAVLWAKLTEPFPEDWVEKLPKPLQRDGQKGRCDSAQFSADGHYCGGWHSRAVHLDYVGHAGITMRLNDVLGPEGWEYVPYALDSDGMPIISRQFYARLTIMGVTKWDLADNFSSAQEAYGDALRRCAMRFGIGTYLWSKSDHAYNLAKTAEPDPEPEPAGRTYGGGQAPEPEPEAAHIAKARALIAGLTQEERDNVGPWWTQQAEAGALPLQANWLALTPAQVADVEAMVADLRAGWAGQEPLPAAQEAPQGPQ